MSTNTTIEIRKTANVLNTLPELVKNGKAFVTFDTSTPGGKGKLKLGDGVEWNDFPKDDIFFKELYIIAKIQTIIDDFGGQISDEQAKNYALVSLETEFGGSVDEIVWSRRFTIIDDFARLLRQNKQTLKKDVQNINVWNLVQPTFSTTSFIISRINHETLIPNTRRLNEIDVFDSIQMNNVVIACFYKDMIKYNLSYKISIDEYLNRRDKLMGRIKKGSAEIIRVMFNSSLLYDENDQSSPAIGRHRRKYQIAVITVTKKVIQFAMEAVIDDRTVPETLRRSLPDVFVPTGEDQTLDYYYGSYTAAIKVPTFVLKEMITNDANVFRVCFINESALINTSRSYLNMFLKGDEVSIAVNERLTGTLIKLRRVRGGSDIDVRIGALMSTINKILQYGTTKIESTLDYYRQYMVVQAPDLEIEERENREIPLKKQAPDIFLSNYTRLCSKPPVIVDETSLRTGQQAGLTKGEGLMTGLSSDGLAMRFPIRDESESKVYMCPYPEYKYPGLRENTKLPNKDVFPFIPCCYKKPQRGNRNVKAYFNQQEFEQRINSGEIGKSIRILGPKRIGSLPPKIDKLLHYSTSTKFYRYGFATSTHSCLDILNMATGNKQTITDIRKRLSERAALCRAECASARPQEIAERILNPKTYISPKLFKNALEDYYQVSYILFSMTNDDFSVYPGRFARFVCPLKQKVLFMVEHEESEHVELVIDENMLDYVNRYGKRPIFLMERADGLIKKIFSIFKERFKYGLFDTQLKIIKAIDFATYPWERIAGNGRIVKDVDPVHSPSASLNRPSAGVAAFGPPPECFRTPVAQYLDRYGQTRIVQFIDRNQDISTDAFDPIPCLNAPVKPIDYFQSSNLQVLNQVQNVNARIYDSFNSKQRLAEYILWAACHVYSKNYFAGQVSSVEDWVDRYTRVVEGFSYAGVEIRSRFRVEQFKVDGKFVFDSLQLRERVAFSISLLSKISLKLYEDDFYHRFYLNVENFKLNYPTQIALSLKEYYQRTKESFNLNILSTQNVRYLKTNTLYFIKELWGLFSSNTCVFLPSFETMIAFANKQLAFPVVVDQTLINVYVLHPPQKTGFTKIDTYSFGRKQPAINALFININYIWFYGLILGSMDNVH
jgi:hypothetical protein